MEAMHTATQVICYVTDAPIPIQDARRLILSDGKPKPSIVQVQAHKDVLAFLAGKGEAQQLGNDFIMFV
jgi:hypothetical protein